MVGEELEPLIESAGRRNEAARQRVAERCTIGTSGNSGSSRVLLTDENGAARTQNVLLDEVYIFESFTTIRPGGHTTPKTSLQGEPAVQPRGTLGQLERQWGPGREKGRERQTREGRGEEKVGKD